MGFALRSGIHFCIADGQVTFLDVEADRYFGLPAKTDTAFQRLYENQTLTESDLTALAPLLRSQVLNLDKRSSKIATVPKVPLPTRAFCETDATNAPALEIAKAVVAELITGRRLRQQPLSKILGALRTRKFPLKPQPPLARAARIVQAFKQSRLWISAQDQCLRTSIALASELFHVGAPCELVIAVRNGPFDAHAWVQAGDTVLNDTVDRVTAYTPIMVI